MAYSAPTRVETDDLPAYARAVAQHFYEDDSDEEIRPYLEAFSTAYRAWAVRDGGRIVGNLGVIETDLSLPGGDRLPIAAVTAVGVAQTARRRGLLREMMTAALDEAVMHDEPVAGLFASESPIYGRFGFGIAARTRDYRIHRVSTRLVDPVDVRQVIAVDAEAARARWPAIHEAMRATRGGSVGLNDGLWQLEVVEDAPSWRRGATARRLVEIPGRGFASYRVAPGATDGIADGQVRVGALIALDADAEAALWQHVCDIDLTATITASMRPPDDALPLMVAEPMALGVREGAPMYLRILDVPRALASRAYLAPGSIVLAVHDPMGLTGGTFRLTTATDGASCRRTDAAADVSLGVDALAGVWLGGIRATSLAAARRLVEHRPGAAAELDRLVAVERDPWTSFVY